MIPFFSLFRREIARFLKVIIQTLITPLVSSFLYLLVFGVSLGSKVNTQKGQVYLAFLIPGLVTMGLINNAFQNSSSSIVTAKYTGELEDLKIVPLLNHHIIWALGLAAVVRGFLVGFVTFLVGSVFYYYQQGQLLGVAHPLELIFFVIGTGMIFGLLGLATAFWAKSFDQLSAVSAFILLPLTYLGGVFISVESLSPFWQAIARLNPLLYLINGMRHSILGVSDVDVTSSFIACLLGLLVLYVLSYLSLKKGSFSRW